MAGFSSLLLGLWLLPGIDYRFLVGTGLVLAVIAGLGMFRGIFPSLNLKHILLTLVTSMTFGWTAFFMEPVLFRGAEWIGREGFGESWHAAMVICSCSALARWIRVVFNKEPLPEATALDVPATRMTEVSAKTQLDKYWWLMAAIAAGLALYAHRALIGGMAAILASVFAIMFTRGYKWPGHSDREQGYSRVPAAICLSLAVFTILKGWANVVSLDGLLPLLPVDKFQTSPILLISGATVPALIGLIVVGIRSRFGVIAGSLWVAYALTVWVFLATQTDTGLLTLAMQAAFVVQILAIGLESLLSAVSHPATQAPKRPTPAPGSLLHQ